MFSKKMDRREFLKVVVASAAAAGLSHFRFLNFGGAGAVLADYYGCTDVIPDYCDPQEPGNVDTCPDPSTSSSDVCIPEQGETDECGLSEPDICAPPPDTPPDICAPPTDPDVCEVPPVEPTPDTCMTAPDDPDICPDGPDGDGDICSLTGQPNPDECIPSVNESDKCSPEEGADFCRPPGGGAVAYDTCLGPLDPDICYESGQNVVDLCTTEPYDPDSTNDVGLSSFEALPTAVPLGAAAVVLGAAAAAIHVAENKAAKLENG